MYGIFYGHPIPVRQGPLQPWEPCCAFGPGRHGPLRTILCHCVAPFLSLSHWQAPQTLFALPKLPQPLVDLVHVASLPARFVGCICQPMWKPGAPVLAELVSKDQLNYQRINKTRSSENRSGWLPQVQYPIFSILSIIWLSDPFPMFPRASRTIMDNSLHVSSAFYASWPC